MVLRLSICTAVQPMSLLVDAILRMSVGDLFREDDCGLGFATFVDGCVSNALSLRFDAIFVAVLVRIDKDASDYKCKGSRRIFQIFTSALP